MRDTSGTPGLRVTQYLNLNRNLCASQVWLQYLEEQSQSQSQSQSLCISGVAPVPGGAVGQDSFSDPQYGAEHSEPKVGTQPGLHPAAGDNTS